VTGNTGTARTIFSHHPECRVSTSNLCTCRELIAAEVRLDRIRHGWTRKRKPLIERVPPMPVALALFAAGAFAANVVNHL